MNTNTPMLNVQGTSQIKDIYTEDSSARTNRVKIRGSAPFTPTYVKAHVTKSADPSQVYASRVQGRHILLENPLRTSKARQEQEAKKARRLADRAKQVNSIISPRDARRRATASRLRESETKFQMFLPLHQLWMGYMSELLALNPPPPDKDVHRSPETVPNSAAMHAKLVKADFHGCLMTVRRSKNPCLVNLSGIVVHETENTFKLVTRNDLLKLVPKQNSVFAFAVPLYPPVPPVPTLSLSESLHLDTSNTPSVRSGATPPTEPIPTVHDLPHVEFELYGNQFCFRAAERAGRKFKHKETIEL